MLKRESAQNRSALSREDQVPLICPLLQQYVVVVVVVLLFYVYGKHLKSCRDGQLT